MRFRGSPVKLRPVADATPGSAARASSVIADLQSDEDAQASVQGKQFRAVVGMLISLTIHLTILLVLALMIRGRPLDSDIEMQLSAVDSSDDQGIIEISANQSKASDEAELDVAEVDDSLWQPATLNLLEPDPLEFPDWDSSIESLESQVMDQGGLENQVDTPGDRSKPDISFFGTHGYGQRFVFVLDVSGSMNERAGGRLFRARTELIHSLQHLSEDHSFYVVLYADGAIPMFGNRGQPAMIDATAENKRRVTAWLQRVRPSGGTKPGFALQLAGSLQPDAIFFLSDGAFIYEPPPGVNGAIEQFLQGFGQARPNRFQPDILVDAPYPKDVLSQFSPEIVVNTIALEDRASASVMEKIAKSKGGQFQFIPASRSVRPPQRRRAVR